MITRRPIMERQANGRLYSRATRRSVRLLTHIDANRAFTLIEMARDVHDADYPEFSRTDGTNIVAIQADRIRDYLSLLSAILLLKREQDKYALALAPAPSRIDDVWAQTLSDAAREYLAGPLKVATPPDVKDELERRCRGLHGSNRVPTLSALAESIGIEGTRNAELFKWAMFLFTDGPGCPFEIRRYPHLARKGADQ